MILKDKVAVVTGGARGIGRAIVEEFAREGAKVYFSDIDRETSAAALAALAEKGLTATFVFTDMGEEEQIAALIAQVAGECGRLDILVNNAGILCDDALLEDTSLAEWNRMLQIDLTAGFLTSKYALPHLRETRGNIVNIASVAGIQASSMDPPYCVAKHGVVGLTRSVAYDYAKFGVRVNAICPAACATEMWDKYLASLTPEEAAAKQAEYDTKQPLGMCHPEDVAMAAAFLASDKAKYITGVAFPVDGGTSAI